MDEDERGIFDELIARIESGEEAEHYRQKLDIGRETVKPLQKYVADPPSQKPQTLEDADNFAPPDRGTPANPEPEAQWEDYGC